MAEGYLDRLVIRALRVPPRPEPPAGSPGTLQVFNAARGFYRYRVLDWGLKQLGTLTGVIVGLLLLDQVISDYPDLVHTIVRVVELLGAGTFVAQLPFTYLMIDLDYRYRWYMVTDTTLRIREGLFRVREQTMTTANIQNLSIHQGPLQRIFGIKDLRVRTAGGGQGEGGSDHETAEGANMHLAYFRGIDNATQIRDLIMLHMRDQRDSGLGDPDDVVAPSPPDHAAAVPSGELLAAAHDLLDESRRLRKTAGIQGWLAPF